MGWLGGDAPEPDPLIGIAALNNAALSKESLDWYKQTYANDILPAQQKDAALREEITNATLASMKQQDQFAADQNQVYRDNFLPVEKQVASDAMGYDSNENVTRRMGIAAANTNQQFSNAEAQSARNLARYGINPNSSAFARENAKLVNAQAVASAGAQTGAAFDTEDRAIALRAGAANFGRNMSNTAATYYGNATTAGSSAGNTSAQGAGIASANAAGMQSAFSNAVNANQSAATISNMDFSGRMQGYQANQQALGGLMQGIGSIAGTVGGVGLAKYLKADGGVVDTGVVHGPGTGISDSIPARNVETGEEIRLSNNEYIIPADVVKRKGIEFFDKLVAKHHTPAHIQRMGIGRG